MSHKNRISLWRGNCARRPRKIVCACVCVRHGITNNNWVVQCVLYSYSYDLFANKKKKKPAEPFFINFARLLFRSCLLSLSCVLHAWQPNEWRYIHCESLSSSLTTTYRWSGVSLFSMILLLDLYSFIHIFVRESENIFTSSFTIWPFIVWNGTNDLAHTFSSPDWWWEQCEKLWNSL